MTNLAKFMKDNPEYAVRIYNNAGNTVVELGRMVGKERLICNVTVSVEELELRRAPISFTDLLSDLKSQIVKEMITK